MSPMGKNTTKVAERNEAAPRDPMGPFVEDAWGNETYGKNKPYERYEPNEPNEPYGK